MSFHVALAVKKLSETSFFDCTRGQEDQAYTQPLSVSTGCKNDATVHNATCHVEAPDKGSFNGRDSKLDSYGRWNNLHGS
jgi:hypothetical protein